MAERFLDIPVDPVDQSGAIAAARKAVAGERSPLLVIAINPEKVMKAQHDPELRDFIEHAGLRIADGVGIVLASRLRGGAVRSRVTGVDLMLQLVAEAEAQGWRVFLLGAQPDVNEAAAEELKRRFPALALAGRRDGYFAPAEDREVAQAIADARTDLLFVALGSPAQERFLLQWGDLTAARVRMGVGGSLDVIAGRVPRAPALMRRAGLEWLYRLYREPWRLRRMLVLPVFLVRACLHHQDRVAEER
jgi:N-acetylglucosaminyldiphosphoundecaprenol N-acetyl-beta-D-mannosaminyltransferase